MNEIKKDYTLITRLLTSCSLDACLKLVSSNRTSGAMRISVLFQKPINNNNLQVLNFTFLNALPYSFKLDIHVVII